MGRRMGVKERNKAIKAALAKEFGFRNVRVKGGRGTAYGWVDIYVTAEKPHPGPCEEPTLFGECEKCREKKEEVRDKVWQILRETELYDEIGVYYDDFNEERKMCTVIVELKEDAETTREKEEVSSGNGYKVVHEGSWTWVYFDEKPDEEIRAKLKEQGFRFSRKRMAWYKPEKTEIVI